METTQSRHSPAKRKKASPSGVEEALCHETLSARTAAGRQVESGLDDIAPVLLRLAQVALVAALGTLLRLGEELVGLILERLLQRSEANLAHEVILELIPPDFVTQKTRIL